jgi:hypothetical protein
MKKPAKTKPVLAWVAVAPGGFIAKWTASTMRRDCQSALIKEFDQQTWKQAYREGWRVVRVEIREVK